MDITDLEKEWLSDDELALLEELKKFKKQVKKGTRWSKQSKEV